jgi:hypothetical protein
MSVLKHTNTRRPGYTQEQLRVLAADNIMRAVEIENEE